VPSRRNTPSLDWSWSRGLPFLLLAILLLLAQYEASQRVNRSLPVLGTLVVRLFVAQLEAGGAPVLFIFDVLDLFLVFLPHVVAEKTTLPRAPADVSDSFRVATSGTRARTVPLPG
jgi:hypothetical protein